MCSLKYIGGKGLPVYNCLISNKHMLGISEETDKMKHNPLPAPAPLIKLELLFSLSGRQTVYPIPERQEHSQFPRKAGSQLFWLHCLEPWDTCVALGQGASVLPTGICRLTQLPHLSLFQPLLLTFVLLSGNTAVVEKAFLPFLWLLCLSCSTTWDSQ